MFILKRIALPGAILILTHAICGLSSADEKPQPAEVQVVALDGNAITFTAEQLRTLPRISVEVADRTGKMVKYSGVAIQHLVIHENAPLGEELRGGALRAISPSQRRMNTESFSRGVSLMRFFRIERYSLRTSRTGNR